MSRTPTPRGRKGSPAASARPSRRTLVIVAALLLLALLGLLAALRSRETAPAGVAGADVSAANGCQGFPQFAPSYGFTGGVIIDTSIPDRMGLVLRDPSQPGKGFQHPSWTKAGNLGPFATDKDGNVYVGPVPKINLLDNPLAGANTIWKVDTTSAEMQPLLDLPAAAPPSERNPFGILGLAYDCDTKTLYASSVAGSGPTSEVGRLYQIDLVARKVVSQLDGVDALSIVVAHTPEGRRLFYGAARQGLIFSVGLDERGSFTGTPRQEVDMAALGADPSERARRLVVSDNALDITGIPFTFSLAVRGSDAAKHHAARYDATTSTWLPTSPPATPSP
jgi:hypothetical protein